ncbi:UNVERIFIED_CONTAM: hypothetical protein Scaly_1923600 [Sesamum calycinum]|uniref:Zinc finger, CCHC-type n=1 Tax=Sesamum calycinum TaxID=2727403 RepID=A0AAW2NIL9_9LAMI
MKDMGNADVILGIKLIHSTDGTIISQSHYVEKIIEKFGYQNSRIAKTPYDFSVALLKNESGVSVAQLRYTSCPDKIHWDALDRLLRIKTHGLNVNPKDQHKAGGLLLLTDVVTLTGSNSMLGSIVPGDNGSNRKEDPEKDPMEFLDDDGALTDGSVVD